MVEEYCDEDSSFVNGFMEVDIQSSSDIVQDDENFQDCIAGSQGGGGYFAYDGVEHQASQQPSGCRDTAIFETALELDKTITVEEDAIEMCRRNGGQKYYNNCVVLICCLACQGIVDTMSKEDRYGLAFIQYQQVLEEWPKKAEAQRVIKAMRRTMNGTLTGGYDEVREWPSEVIKAATNFIQKTKKGGGPEKPADVGGRIWNQYANAQKIICNHFNPLWRDLGSGENETQLLEAIRKRIWEQVTARELAVSRLSTKQNKISKKLKKNRTQEEQLFFEQMDGNSNTAKKNRQEWKHKEQCIIASEYDVSDAYPATWLAFIVLGQPAYSKLISNFNTGFHHSKNSTSSPNTLAGNLGKKQRRAMTALKKQNTPMSSSSTISNITNAEGKKVPVEGNKELMNLNLVVKKENPKLSDYDLIQKLIDNCENRINRAIKRNKSITELEDEMDALLDKQSLILKKAMIGAEMSDHQSKRIRTSSNEQLEPTELELS